MAIKNEIDYRFSILKLSNLSKLKPLVLKKTTSKPIFALNHL